MRKVVLAMSLAILIAGLCFGNQQSAPDFVSSFKEIAAKHIASYQTDHRVSVGEFGNPARWRREWFDVEPKYAVDVQSTNSLISPYVGVFEFRLRRYLSKMWDRKEDAEKDTTPTNVSLVKHRHTFAYQDKKWVVTKREHFNEELSPVDSLNTWRDCEEVLPNGQTNIFGCFEELTPKPTPTPTPKKPQSPRRRRPLV